MPAVAVAPSVAAGRLWTHDFHPQARLLMADDAILLVNLGSPDSPDVADVRRYLGQFLMDPFVIDAPYPIRRLIVSGFILPFRPKQSAEAYRSIWTDAGSPLVVTSRAVAQALGSRLEQPIALGMRYGNPSIRSALEELLVNGQLRRILAVPLYPHYALSSVTTVAVEIERQLRTLGASVELQVLPPFYDDERYIGALSAVIRDHLDWPYDHVLFSFHGLPERHLRKADPTGAHCLRSATCCETPSPAHARCYRHQTRVTTRLVAERCGLAADRHSIAFQSRLGKDSWLKPFTDRELVRLAGQGVRRIAVVCPAFVSDCLETLEEIGIRGRRSFLDAGGDELRLIPCMNEDRRWIDALAAMCTSTLTTPVPA